MLDEMTESVIRETTTERLNEMYNGLVTATSLRSFQGMGTDEALNEMLAEIVAEMNARRVGGLYARSSGVTGA